jgi:hypothetical protein
VDLSSYFLQRLCLAEEQLWFVSGIAVGMRKSFVVVDFQLLRTASGCMLGGRGIVGDVLGLEAART